MLTFPTDFANHIEGSSLTLTVCWLVQRRDGTYLRGTAHDRTITITTGDYAGTYPGSTAIMGSDIVSRTEGSVKNMEVEGAFAVDASAVDMTDAEIEAGVWDQAPATLLLVNWSDPDQHQKVLMHGTLGEFTRDSDGRYRTEVRGLTQALSQNIMDTYSERCTVKRFGNSRCGLDIAALSRTGTVDTVTSRRRFTATLDAGPAPADDAYYYSGVVRFTTGDNAGFEYEIRAHSPVDGSEGIDILFFDEAAADIAATDEFELEPGCDRIYATCRYTYNNLANFRGYGLFATGRDRLIRDPASAVTETAVTIPSSADNDTSRAALAAAMQALLT